MGINSQTVDGSYHKSPYLHINTNMKRINQLCWVLTMTILGALASTTVQADVRKSNSGMCHVQGESPYYNRLKHFKTYDDLDACMNPSGHIRKLSDTVPDYNRNAFGSGWADDDKDGQNTRAEILIDQSTGPVTFSDDREVVVLTGRWISIFTNKIIVVARYADIDHIVPLKWAWDHGAYKWDYEKRLKFANDPRNLAAVEAGLNRSKGAKGPTEWLPPENKCGYVLRFIRLYKTYGLELSDSEQKEMDTTKILECRK